MSNAPDPALFEKLGAFYMGRSIETPDGDPTDDVVLYDSKDLTTHGVIVGMTGSGKTGLAVGMLEEAALDGVPAIALDVKGDLTNLLLTFPDLLPEDFEPWIDPAAAARKGVSTAEMAKGSADLWRGGLADWGQSPDRIRAFREAVDLALYSPGSTAATPVSLLKSFDPPPASIRNDGDAMRERIMGTVSGLLTLLDIDADPVRSRDHILLSNILDTAWRERRSLDLAGLIRQIQRPPFESVGVLDLETFYPADDRMELAMMMNNLLASPGFQTWRSGEPLDIGRLLWTAEGKPRLSILYIAHLSEAERMFFVTRLLNEVVLWMRTQSGTGSLRALLYMDEVFGYFPPTANPPSKKPLLTLMKQARAYGVGVLLATQNPVDLDYKGLSNAGTWMLGRLQTERDKIRMLDGLEGAGGGGFDRAEVDRVLSSLGKRRFMLHNVHESGPVLFQTRWVLSYLRGPLTLEQVRRLAEEYPAASASGQAAGAERNPNTDNAAAAPAPADPRPAVPAPESAGANPADSSDDGPPILDPDIEQSFARVATFLPESVTITYRPALLGRARLHYVRASWNVDEWMDTEVLAPSVDDRPWEDADTVDTAFSTSENPDAPAAFENVPSDATRKRSYAGWANDLEDHLYRTRSVTLYKSTEAGLESNPGEEEGAFRARIRHALHEHRDAEIEQLRSKYERKFDSVEKRILTAEQRVTKEQTQYDQRKLTTALNVGTTLLGALMGRKKLSRSTMSGASRTATGWSRAAKEKQDIELAEDKLEAVRAEFAELESELEAEISELRERLNPEAVELEPLDRSTTWPSRSRGEQSGGV